MPTAPKPACPRCHHVRCTCAPGAGAKPSGWGQGTTQARRPGYAADTLRRRRVVRQWLAANGERTEDGHIAAVCPECGQWSRRFVADHIVPLGEGGTEGGELRVHCKRCSDRQGARIARQRRGQKQGKA